jgi:hypothetical protein
MGGLYLPGVVEALCEKAVEGDVVAARLLFKFLAWNKSNT